MQQHSNPATKSLWEPSTPGLMTAVLLDEQGARIIELPCQQPEADIAERVGDPRATRVDFTQDTVFWVGETVQHTAELNEGATRFLYGLLSTIASGDYAASDPAAAQAVLNTPGYVPALYGHAIITGTTDDGTPGPLGEAFTRWFEASLAFEAELNAVASLLQELGLYPATVVDVPDNRDSD
ncbi:hypothetical protein [Saccharopolyspora endophytica]|uniref:Uncharacterized protein n=1 Tax=Saccharopolyspora endophytica TaxID=543886 RepID=A0ABS5DQK4_9PSEU|nr:hypothetical protein [Saccharopolyspora endophytica]MBQ0928580.1 hypothetical protein [Saccharopolyspora endophytica]